MSRTHQRLDGLSSERRAYLLLDLASHLIRLREFGRLQLLLVDLEVLAARCGIGLTYQAIDEFQAALAVGEYSEADARTLREFLGFLRKHVSVLRQNPELTFQLAANEPDGTAPALAAGEAALAAEPDRPWLRWLNKRQTPTAYGLLMDAHRGSVLACDFSPCGRRLVTTGRDAAVRVWDTASGEPLAVRENELRPGWCRFSQDGERIAFGLPDGGVCLWDPSDQEPPTVAARLSLPANNGAFTPDGRGLLLAAGQVEAEGRKVSGGSLSRLELRTGVVEPLIEEHPHPLTACAVSRDGHTRVAVAAGGGLVVCEHSAAGVRTVCFQGERGGNSCSISPDGSRVLISPGFQMWDLELGVRLPLPYAAGTGAGAAVFTPDGQWIVSGHSDRTVRIWQSRSGAPVASFKEHAAAVSVCTISPDSELLATGSNDGVVMLWHLPTLTAPARTRTSRSATA